MLPGVEKFVMGGDFDRWLDSVELYLDAIDVTAEARKKAILLYLIGPDLQQVYSTLPEPVGVAGGGAYAVCKAKLEAYLAPARNTIAEKLAFQTVKMGPDEKFDSYLARLRVAAGRCGFTAQSVDREVRDQCLAGTHGKLQERLLQRAAEKGDDLTLQDVVMAAATMERTQALIAQMRGPTSGAAAEPMQLVAGGSKGICFKCGQPGHIKSQCPNQQRTPRPQRQRREPVCFRCRKPGHFRKECTERAGTRRVHEIADPEVGQLDLWQVELVNVNHVVPQEVTLEVNGRPMSFSVDTGSPVSIIGANVKVPGLSLKQSQLALSSYTGHPIPIKGEGMVQVRHKQGPSQLRLAVADLQKATNLRKEMI